jgi:hypothetical protein
MALQELARGDSSVVATRPKRTRRSPGRVVIRHGSTIRPRCGSRPNSATTSLRQQADDSMLLSSSARREHNA